MRFSYLKIIGLVIIFLFNACNFPVQGQTVPGTDAGLNITPTAQVVPPPQNNESVECAFVWANDPLPELSEAFNKALKEIQSDAEGYAQAYGENCVTAQGEVVRFLAMETDFYITLNVENLEDRQALGDGVEQVMEVMAEFPTDETPGPQPGYIGITFEATGDSLRLWIMRAEIETALANGLRGEELFNAMQK